MSVKGGMDSPARKGENMRKVTITTMRGFVESKAKKYEIAGVKKTRKQMEKLFYDVLKKYIEN